MKIFFSVGEPSGDLHGANLIRALRARRPDVECVGYGGPRMAEAGCRLHFDLTTLAVMWFLRVLANLHQFLWLLREADEYFARHRPDAVVLVDYPGFNWWIARRAKAHGIPVFYYVPPQIWAWASWRVGKMRRFVDHVLCSLPFEAAWFAERGCRATFIGHPYFDEVRRDTLDRGFLASLAGGPPLVTLLPGSRTQEVQHNLPWLLKAAARIRQAVPQVRFAIASFKPHQAALAQRALAAAGVDAEVYLRRTPELIHAARCCLAVSGSVSLELLYHQKPTAILYWIPRHAHWLQGWFRHIPYITLVNLLDVGNPFDRTAQASWPAPESPATLFPEYLTYRDPSAELAQHAVTWLTDEAAYAERVARLAALRDRIGHGGASARGAEYILAHVPERRRIAPRPHYVPGTALASSGGWQEPHAA